MEIKKDKVRVNINLSSKVKEFFEEKSIETGIPQSSLMAMALSEYMEQKKALDMMGTLIKRLDDMERSINNLNNRDATQNDIR